MKFSVAIDEGFSLYMKNLAYADDTISAYTGNLHLMCALLQDPDVSKISIKDIRMYLQYIETTYVPKRVSKKGHPLGNWSVKNHLKSIRRFFDFAEKELALSQRPDIHFKLPKIAPNPVLILDDTELVELMKYLDKQPGNANKHPLYQDVIGVFLRLRAIVLLFLDTGITSSELRMIDVSDFDPRKKTLLVKKTKSTSSHHNRHQTDRLLNLAHETSWAITQYLDKRTINELSEPLFTDTTEERMTTNAIRCMLRRLADKLDIQALNADVLRDTFAVNFLRKIPNIDMLKTILGITDSDKLKLYLQLANCDIKAAHQVGSPVAAWFGGKK